jgi:hypothetical protein
MAVGKPRAQCYMADKPKSEQALNAPLWKQHNRLASQSLATVYRELAAL